MIQFIRRNIPPYQDPTAFKSGDVIGFSRTCHWWDPSTWLSWRIQRDTMSVWNHVGLLYWNGREWEVIEALALGGVVCTPLCNHLEPELMLAMGEIELAHDRRLEVVDFALKAVGCAYDYWKIVKIRLLQLIIGHSKAVEMVRAQEDDRVFICSELAIRAYRAGGSDIGGDFGSPCGVMESVRVYRVWNGQRWLEFKKEVPGEKSKIGICPKIAL